MATQFDPDPKAYKQEFNGLGKESQKAVNQNSFNMYGNNQPDLQLVSPQSVLNAVEHQQLGGFVTAANPAKSGGFQWRNLRLTQKATALAIALGTLPVLLTGVTAYQFANRSITEQITQSKISSVASMQDKVNRFMRDRYGDIQILANLPVLTNPSQRDTTPLGEKQSQLDRFIAAHKVYDLISVVDLNGNVIVQTKGLEPIPNQREREYFQEVLKTNQPVISDAIIPKVSKNPERLTLHFAAPVKDSATGKTIAVIRARMPVTALEEQLQTFGANGDEFLLIDSSTKNIFLAKDKNLETKEPSAVFSEWDKRPATEKPNSLIVHHKPTNDRELIAYTKFGQVEGLPTLDWEAVIAIPTDIAFASQRQLLLILSLGTGLTALLVSALAVYLAKLATRPVLAVSDAVEKLGQGELYTRVAVEGQDELAELGSNINLMASRLETLLWAQAAETEQAGLFGDIAVSNARTEKDLEDVFEKGVQGALRILEADRVVIYRLHPDGRGYISAEAVVPVWPRALGAKIEDPCIGKELLEEYRQGRVVPTNNVYEAGFHPDHLRLMDRLQIKANLVTPILKDGHLFGLLIAHHCSNLHIWQQSEINFLKELAIRVGLCLDRVSFLEQKEVETLRAQQLHEITSTIRDAFSPEDIYQTAIAGVREALQTDRAVVYLFDDKWQGTIVAESVGMGWPKALGANITDPCFADKYVEKYLQGRVKAVEDIYEAGLSNCYMGQLEPFKVRANLVAPLLAYNKLHGLLVTHQCSNTRAWQESEITFFKQVATQVGLALDRVDFLAQIEQSRHKAETLADVQRQQKETLQQQLLELLSDVEGAAQGDLTVRADVTTGEIGTVADFFNAVIESLREIVTKVKTAAGQVNTSLGENEGAIRQLSEEALKQAEETTRTLDSVQEMTLSIQQVAKNARQAAVVARTASTTAEAGGIAIDRSVRNIFTLRETVAETAKKVKRLGESSQKISKVASLIDQIALQTNLLAINAGIEAARAGEEGQGFAVVAEEVGELAARSAAATREIEEIVHNIQKETTEVVEAMELGTSQVVEGTNLVEDAKQSLHKILDVSREIDDLVQSISTATVTQAETSQAVTELMKEIALVSERTSNSTRKVSGSLKETVEIAQELQASVGAFKVDGL
ncbi:methyl-accepting chemotaxis protein [Allocoleopsis franciscana]|uniref:Methyl-accepting chemotaxis protein n=1 Tax=Allocoleopsis franciscana PCC 7113 TaxID=1173027 RepID=K9WIR3_9CYAN|nr:methyl-accepting chemotaxis protein [Allocoleopsis franciscana]AFZ20063.1 methyl-accepting chemotaxis protein [Allocoleopsis franciscana PCC 7113]